MCIKKVDIEKEKAKQKYCRMRFFHPRLSHSDPDCYTIILSSLAFSIYIKKQIELFRTKQNNLTYSLHFFVGKFLAIAILKHTMN